MFQKEPKSDLPKLEQPSDYFLPLTNLEDCLTPTTLAIFNSAMSESGEQTFSNFSGFSQEKMEGFSGENLSDDETGDDSSESFDTRSRLVPVTNQSSSDQYSNRTQPTQKVKSLKRKLPGPRPAFSDDELTEEEMQRRVRRRERNKMAAARCRQRRVDQTNELLNETKQLETEASRLEKEIESLERLKSKLEVVLQSHIPMCTANVQDGQISSSTSGSHRPSSPPLYLAATPQSSLVLVTLPAPKSQIMSSAVVPTCSESLANLPMRPNTLPIMTAPTSSGNELGSDTSIFSFGLPPVSSSPLTSAADLSFSASDFLTPTTLEQQKLFD